MRVSLKDLFRVLARFSPNIGSRERDERRLILASGLFDAEYYLEQYLDVARSGDDAATHYLRHGGIEGRNPSAHFDGNYYLTSHADVRAAKINPLVHYLIHGQQEGRNIRAVTAPAPKAKPPTSAQWVEIGSSSRRPKDGATIDIVIPAFRGFAETATCIYTVVRSRLAAEFNCEIVVIDDVSPEPELSRLLDQLAEAGHITLLRNSRNEGFVASVNKGMRLHEDRDVVLLNSDTEVFGDWVERLRRAAYSGDDIGTVTPLSNNATICGYPNFPSGFDGAFEVPFEQIDRLASEANAGMTVEIPTAVGFCMYIRRKCLREVGFFDAETFGIGYGEENDFCKRAVAQGWRNVLAGDVFVRHLARVSFAETTTARVTQALRIINARYPGYDQEIAAYIKRDPPKQLRRNLDLARLRHALGKRFFLFFLHNLGGGTERHVRELATELASLGIGALLLRPHPQKPGFAEIGHFSVTALSVIKLIDIRHGVTEAIDLFRSLGIAHIHVHHTLGFAPEIIHFVQSVAEGCEVEYDVTIHDYLTVCPRIDMIDGSGIYCDNSNLETCESCVARHGSRFGDVGVSLWRANYRQFLTAARKVFVPDKDVSTRLVRFLPTLPTTVRPHPEQVPKAFAPPLARKSDEPLRVAVIGAIGRHKGSDLLLQCAEDALNRRLPIKFIVFGFVDKRELRKLPNVEITGSYAESDLPLLLAQGRCHLSFFPAVWPETYSYTLSQSFFSGLYPVAFDLGALARRIREARWGHVLPFRMVREPAFVNDALLSLRVESPPSDWRPVAGAELYTDVLRDYYQLRFGSDETALSPRAIHTPPTTVSMV